MLDGLMCRRVCHRVVGKGLLPRRHVIRSGVTGRLGISHSPIGVTLTRVARGKVLRGMGNGRLEMGGVDCRRYL